jgi:hypothetical protein
MRKNIVAVCAVVAMALAVLTIPAKSQQAKPSPAATTQCQLAGGKTITTDYSSPRMRGRKVYGELVPWGKVWRAGANEATTFVTTADVNVGGKTVPAGNYTIFVVPTAEKWTLIVQKTKGEWGIPYPPPQKDAGGLHMIKPAAGALCAWTGKRRARPWILRRRCKAKSYVTDSVAIQDESFFK